MLLAYTKIAVAFATASAPKWNSSGIRPFTPFTTDAARLGPHKGTITPVGSVYHRAFIALAFVTLKADKSHNTLQHIVCKDTPNSVTISARRYPFDRARHLDSTRLQRNYIVLAVYMCRIQEFRSTTMDEEDRRTLLSDGF